MVELVNYETKWPVLYAFEKEKVTSMLKDFSIEVHHIGSTAVPNMVASPIIDVLIGVQRSEDLKSVIEILQNGPYVYIEESNIFIALKDEASLSHYPKYIKQNDFYCQMPNHIQHAHLYVTAINSTFWNDCLLFQDELKRSERFQEGYIEMKHKLASSYWNDSSQYKEGKQAYIQSYVSSKNLQSVNTK
ncbi:GrpB family protein [Priestia flexa]|uniref:GrpB family protein n=1 Tax=Priestia flexa TaxID=86664 RepID=UPI001B34298F|nr:GrpB family protein [Priestia flexa]